MDAHKTTFRIPFVALAALAAAWAASCARNAPREAGLEALYPPLRDAAAGDVVTLPPGRFSHFFLVPAGVTLRGAGPDKTALSPASADQECVAKLGPRAILEGVCVEGGRFGVQADFADGFQLIRCAVRGAREAGLLASNGPGRLADCEFAGAANRAAGILVRNAALQIERVRFQSLASALIDDKEFPSELTVADCQARSCGDGFHLRGSRLEMRGASVEDCADDGLDMAGDAQASFEDCRFARCADSGAEIALDSETRIRFARCAFEQNGRNGLTLLYGGLAGPLRNAVRLEACGLNRNRFYGVGLLDAQGRSQPDPAIRFPLVLAETAFSGNGSGEVSPGTVEAPLEGR